jgi:hypothetical protein
VRNREALSRKFILQQKKAPRNIAGPAYGDGPEHEFGRPFRRRSNSPKKNKEHDGGRQSHIFAHGELSSAKKYVARRETLQKLNNGGSTS